MQLYEVIILISSNSHVQIQIRLFLYSYSYRFLLHGKKQQTKTKRFLHLNFSISTKFFTLFCHHSIHKKLAISDRCHRYKKRAGLGLTYKNPRENILEFSNPMAFFELRNFQVGPFLRRLRGLKS